MFARWSMCGQERRMRKDNMRQLLQTVVGRNRRNSAYTKLCWIRWKASWKLFPACLPYTGLWNWLQFWAPDNARGRKTGGDFYLLIIDNRKRLHVEPNVQLAFTCLSIKKFKNKASSIYFKRFLTWDFAWEGGGSCFQFSGYARFTAVQKYWLLMMQTLTTPSRIRYECLAEYLLQCSQTKLQFSQCRKWTKCFAVSECMHDTSRTVY